MYGCFEEQWDGVPAAYASATALTWALAVSCVVADAKALAAAWASLLLSADATALALALAAAVAACMPNGINKVIQGCHVSSTSAEPSMTHTSTWMGQGTRYIMM